MIFINVELSDLLPELELFLWQIVGHASLKNFSLFTGGNYLKVAFCHIDFYLVEYFSTLQPEI